MNSIGYQSVFHEAQKRGWINTRSGSSRPVVTTVASKAKGFAFSSASELVASPKPVHHLIRRLIEIASLLLLFGQPGTAKSFVALAWSIAVAMGFPWMGRATTQGSVFYLAGEGHAGIARRLKAWEIHNQASLAGAPLFISQAPAALMSEASAMAVTEAITALCIEHGTPALIVIDTFARNMGDGDENSNADVGVFINRIDNMRAELGCAILLVHHVGHGAIDRARGASSLHAAMDAVFRIDKNDSGMTMIQIKAKESELVLPISLALEQVTLTGWPDDEGEDMTSAVVVAGAADASIGARLTRTQERDLEFFRSVARTHGYLSPDGQLVGLHVDAWRDEHYRQSNSQKTDTKKTAFLRSRDSLVAVGRLRLDGDWYLFTGPNAMVENYALAAEIRTRGNNGTPAQ